METTQVVAVVTRDGEPNVFLITGLTLVAVIETTKVSAVDITYLKWSQLNSSVDCVSSSGALMLDIPQNTHLKLYGCWAYLNKQ